MPGVIVFDLNGSLLDPESLAPLFGKLTGDRYTPREFFNELAQYSMAATLAGEHRGFSEIAAAVLEMSAAARGAHLGAGAMDVFRDALAHMAPFPDARAGLDRLEKAGYRLAVLTNSEGTAARRVLENGGLDRYFEQVISAESTFRFPFREVAPPNGAPARPEISPMVRAWVFAAVNDRRCRRGRAEFLRHGGRRSAGHGKECRRRGDWRSEHGRGCRIECRRKDHGIAGRWR